MSKEKPLGQCDISPIDNLLYKKRSYAELSSEFKKLFPTAHYAFQLIPQMYNRLTLIDKFSHKVAIARMYKDHKKLPGFSGRNVRRYLPADNPNVPRRIRTSRPKTSIPKLNPLEKLSNTQLGIGIGPTIIPENSTGCQNCLLLERKTEELEQALKAATNLTTGDIIKKCQSETELRFPLKILDIKKYLAYQKHIGRVHQSEIWIIAKIDTTKGISATIEGLENNITS